MRIRSSYLLEQMWIIQMRIRKCTCLPKNWYATSIVGNVCFSFSHVSRMQWQIITAHRARTCATAPFKMSRRQIVLSFDVDFNVPNLVIIYHLPLILNTNAVSDAFRIQIAVISFWRWQWAGNGGDAVGDGGGHCKTSIHQELIENIGILNDFIIRFSVNNSKPKEIDQPLSGMHFNGTVLRNHFSDIYNRHIN